MCFKIANTLFLLVYKDNKIIKFTYRIYYKNKINDIVEFEIPVKSSCNHFPLLFPVKWPFRDRSSTVIHYITTPFCTPISSRGTKKSQLGSYRRRKVNNASKAKKSQKRLYREKKPFCALPDEEKPVSLVSDEKNPVCAVPGWKIPTADISR